MERIAVVGAGLMGHGIAQVFARAGHAVAVHDADPGTLASVPARVRANLERIGADPSPAEEIELHAELEDAVRGANFVIEAAREDIAVKRTLFERMSAVAGEETILATNTSVISIGEIAKDALDPGRVVGTHWWNPPQLVPLVEVTQAEHTRPDTVERTMALLRSVGKSPVHVKKDVPGFVGNRMQHALWREAIALVEAGVVDAAEIDEIVKQSFGLRLSVLGPIENADLVGLDLTLAIHDYLLPYIDSSPEPAPLLRDLVVHGDLGMKTGRGFRAWSAKEADAVRERLFDHLVAVTGAAAQTPAPKEEQLR
jgi:3-hydroxybutyryl-CoA dehydrogenase